MSTAPAAHGFVSFSIITYGTYDEQYNNMNYVDAEAAGNNITLAEFKNDLQQAYIDDLGGVINFEIDFLCDCGIVNKFEARFGEAFSSKLTVTRTGPLPTDSFDINSSNSGGIALSGTQLFILGGSDDFTLSFSQPLAAWGFTALSRTAQRTGVMTITFSDSSTEVFPSEVIAAGTGNDDTFFGYEAPANNPITSVSWVGDAFVRWDDLGFIVACSPGDTNGDCSIDLADFEVIRDHLGITNATREQGDMTLDGVVDLNDFIRWKRLSGYAGSLSALGAVPEPMSLLPLAIGIVVVLDKRSRGHFLG